MKPSARTPFLVTIITLTFVLSLLIPSASGSRAGYAICQDGTANELPPMSVALNQLPVISPQNASQMVQVRQLGRGPIAEAVLSPDGMQLAVATSLGIWLYSTTETSDQARLLSGHIGAVTSISFSADSSTVVSGGEDCTARIWDVRTGTLLRTLRGHSDAVTQVAFSPDGKTIGTGSADQTARLWDSNTGNQSQVLASEVNGIAGGIRSIAFSPDSQWFAYSSTSGGGDYVASIAIQFWNLQQQKSVEVLPSSELLSDYEGSDIKISFSPDGKKFAYLLVLPTIIEFPSGRSIVSNASLPTPTESDVFEDAAIWIDNYIWRSTSDSLITVTTQGDPNYEASTTIQLYNITTGTYTPLLENQAGSLTPLATDNDDLVVLSGQNVAVSTVDHWIMSNDHLVAKDKTLFTLPDHNYATTVLDLNPDAHYIALGGYENRDVILREVDSGKEGMRLPGHEIQAESIAFSPNSNQIVSVDFNGTIRLFEMQTGKTRWSTPTKSTVWDIAFSPDGTLIGSASGDYREGGVALWDVNSGKQVALFTSETASTVAFSSDGSTIAAGIEGNSTTDELRIWDIATKKQLQVMQAPNGRILGLAYSPDGKFLATVNADYSTQLWNITTGKPITVVASAGGYNTRAGIAFSPDGKILATTQESEIVLLDMTNQRELITLTAHTNRIEQITFSRDGKLLVSGGDDYAVRVWGIP